MSATNSAFSWQNSANLCPPSFCTPRPNLTVTQISLDFLLLYSSPLWWKGQLFLVLVLGGVVSLYRTVQLLTSSALVAGAYTWIIVMLNGLTWNWDHSVFWDCTQVFILNSSVDYEDYSTFSKGFWLTVVDIMVIWIKFAHSYPFLVHWFLKCQCSLLPSPAWPHPIHGPNIPGSYAIQRIFSRVVSNPSQVMPFGLHIVKG